MPPRLETLLLATEHTEFDTGAERVALALAARWRQPLSVVRPLVSNPEYEALAPEIAQRAAESAAAGMDELRALARTAGVGLDVRVRSGEEPWREIVAETQERRADLLITRRRGKAGWLARLMVGEMVSQVVKHAPCSVLLVPRATELWTERVIAAVDGSPISAQVAATAALVAVRGGLPLIIVSAPVVDTAEARAEAEVALADGVSAARATGCPSPTAKLLASGNVHERILAEVPAHGLVVIGRHGRTALSASAFGGVTHKVIGHAVGPVLIVKG